MLNDKTPKQVENDLKAIFKKYGLENKISVDEIKKWIWNSTGAPMEASNKYNKKCIELFPPINDIDEFNILFQTFVDAWNSFPHKALKGKSPKEMFNEIYGKAPPSKPVHGNKSPDVIVGGRKMPFGEFQAMLKEMEKAQKPFKKWIDKSLLPKYKKYLKLKEKNESTREEAYSVADIFFQRALHLGFVDLEHIRPEFILDEFPRWWPTHVIGSHSKPSQIKKYLGRLFNFIEFSPDL